MLCWGIEEAIAEDYGVCVYMLLARAVIILIVLLWCVWGRRDLLGVTRYEVRGQVKEKAEQ